HLLQERRLAGRHRRLDIARLAAVDAHHHHRLRPGAIAAAVDDDVDPGAQGAVHACTPYAACAGAVWLTPISARISRTACTAPRMWSALSRPMQPIRKLSATVSLPG